MKGFMYAALLIAALFGAACSEQTEAGSKGSSQGESVLGGTGTGPGSGTPTGPGQGTSPGTGNQLGPAIAVHHNYLRLPDGGADDLGARGWSVPGPIIDYQIHNTGSVPLVLTGSPRVQVSDLINVSAMTVTQPPVTTILPGRSTSFGLVFTVDTRTSFNFRITIPSNAVAGQVGPTFDFVVKGEGARQLFYGRWETQNFGQPEFYVNGAAALNPELHLSHLQNAYNRSFSPNGKFGVASVDTQFTVFMAQDGTIAPSLPPLPPNLQEFGSVYAWHSHTTDEQWLGVIRRDNTGRANHVFVYRISTMSTGGVDTPQVDLLGQVQMAGQPPLDAMNLSSLIWSKDGTRLSFRDMQDDFTQTAQVWACVVTAGVPGVATNIASLDPGVYPQPEAEVRWSSNEVVVLRSGTSLYRVTVDSSSGVLTTVETVILAERVRNWRLSPNGTRVAYESWSSSGSEWDMRPYGIEVSAAGGQPTLLLTLIVDYEASLPQIEWTPDGAGVVYTGTYLGPSNNVFFQRLTSATGPLILVGGTVSLTQDVPPASSAFVLSPEGKRVAIITWSGDWPTYTTSVGLATLEAVPQRVHLWDDTVTYPSPWGGIHNIQFSPRGDFVSFQAPHEVLPGQPKPQEIYMVPLSGPILMKPGTAFTASNNASTPGVIDYVWLR